VLFQLSAVQLHALDNGAEYLLFVMIAVWLADTGGYFAGKRWGKHKLAPYISPNKTWQGVYGAVALVSVWAAISFYSFFAINASFMEWLALMMVAAVISIVGDLFESVFKRLHDVKDSGNLLPGHGGVLDRIDSLLAAVPVFFAGLSLVGMR
jgi:phosphatidate cytidylyltransferase